jgi:hypothetical protein
MRRNPLQPDSLDGARLEWLKHGWHSQDDVLRSRDRTIEENIRMLCGRQWSQYNPYLQKWIDVGEWMGQNDKYWQQRPVVNRLLYWFMLTHARMTENPSIVSFQPASPDRLDQMLAEVMDTVTKTVWQQAGMDDAIDWRAAWMIPCGQSYLYPYIDPDAGELKPWIGPGMLPVMDELGQPYLDESGQPLELMADAVPYDKTGQPLAVAYPDGSYEVTGEPHVEPSGALQIQALCALQVRGEWSQRPWHRKRFHYLFAHTSLEEIYDRWGVEVAADGASSTGSQYELSRILNGSGWYGAMGGGQGDGLVTLLKDSAGLYTRWDRPSKEYPETADGPGGRMMVGTATRLIYDGPRNAAFPHTSPLHEYRFVNLPGRPGATTPQEALNPLQRSYNRGYGQMQEYRNLCTNPVGVIDQVSGIRDKDIVNKPGLLVTAIKRQGVAALEYVNPPRIGEEVFRVQALLRQEMRELSWVEGAEGTPPTLDASGELVKELRFNADRGISATQRRNVVEDARLVETLLAYIKILWDEEKILTYAGEDNIAMTVTVLPEMFQFGRVNVVPIIESARPEGSGERQARAEKLYQLGVWGPAGTPGAARAFMQMSRFTHLGRFASAVGGIDEVTANQENGQMVLGVQAQEIETYEFYDHLIHLDVHTRFMRTPEFKQLSPEVKMSFMLHRQLHEMLAQPALEAMAAQASAESDGGGNGPPSDAP